MAPLSRVTFGGGYGILFLTLRGKRHTFRENDEGLVVLDMENKGFFNRIAQRFFHRPQISHITLDQYGTTLWNCLDGKTSVFAVTEKMKRAFPGEEEQMPQRCLQFLRTLESNRLISR